MSETPDTPSTEPLTPDEEREWRRWSALPRGRAARWLSTDVDRLWATLDAARAVSTEDTARDLLRAVRQEAADTSGQEDVEPALWGLWNTGERLAYGVGYRRGRAALWEAAERPLDFPDHTHQWIERSQEQLDAEYRETGALIGRWYCPGCYTDTDTQPDGALGWAWECVSCDRPVPPMGMCQTCGVFGVMRLASTTTTTPETEG